MDDSIFLIQTDNSLVELRQEDYDSEVVLQRLLAEHPNILARGGESPAWLLIEREAGIPKESGSSSWWALDHLFIDREGVPTLVEVKRKTDTRLRREVVAQMLDYAANAVVNFTGEGSLRHRFETRCAQEKLEPRTELARCLGDGIDFDAFWQEATTHLEASRIRLVFVADEIPQELLRIVEFLNEQLRTIEVLAIEVRQYVGGTLRTLVPHVLGQTVETRLRKTQDRRRSEQWTEERFFSALTRNRSAEVAEVARRIYSWAHNRRLEIWFGRGAQSGGWIPNLTWNGIRHQLFEVWTGGEFEIPFQWYSSKAPFEAESLRLELLRKLEAIEGVRIGRDRLDRRPNVDIGLFSESDALNRLLGVFDWVIETIQNVD